MKEYIVRVGFIKSSTSPQYETVEANALSKQELNNFNNKGFKGFVFSGGSKTNNSGCFFDGSFKFFSAKKGYSGFLGTCLSNADGTFSIEQYINLNNIAQSASGMVIVQFDRVAGEYATEYTVGGNTQANDSYTLIIPAANFNGNPKIVFNKWSRANSLLKIVSITYDLQKDYGRRQLRGLKYTNYAQSGSELTTFGVVSQSGSCTVVDDGLIKQLNELDLLKTGLDVLVLENGIQTQEFVLEDFDQDLYNKTWTFTLADGITEWENENFAGLDYAERTLKAILDLLIPGAVYRDCDDIAQLRIPNSYLQNSSKWQAVNKCCALGLLRVYRRNGITYVRRFI